MENRIRFLMFYDKDVMELIARDARKRRTSRAQIIREVLLDNYKELLSEEAKS